MNGNRWRHSLLAATVSLGSWSCSDPPDSHVAPTTTISSSTSADSIADVQTVIGRGAPIELTCTDSATAGVPPAPTDLSVAGLVLSGVSAVDFSSAGEFPLAKGTQTFTLRKVFVYVTPQASAITSLRVVGPTNAALIYHPLNAESGQPVKPSESDWLSMSAKSVSFENCHDATTGYIGGLIVAGPTCLELEIKGSETRSIVLPILTDRC